MKLTTTKRLERLTERYMNGGIDRRAFLGLALADHQQVRDLGERVLAHLVVDFLVPRVGVDANARRL